MISIGVIFMTICNTIIMINFMISRNFMFDPKQERRSRKLLTDLSLIPTLFIRSKKPFPWRPLDFQIGHILTNVLPRC